MRGAGLSGHPGRMRSQSSYRAPVPMRAWTVWTILGLTVATVLVIGGLIVAGVILYLVVGLSMWADNK